MAAVAEKGADRIVVTSDNPRSEKPEAIVSQILLGLARPGDAPVEVDRARAIADTVEQADDADVLLLAGKGHEEWQEVAGWRHPFSDVQQAQAALAARSGA
jgi:UDP-N-acetylmuramoyl-L-alanyl-D-glutamate--2,6-diaminopimelate ligase